MLLMHDFFLLTSNIKSRVHKYYFILNIKCFVLIIDSEYAIGHIILSLKPGVVSNRIVWAKCFRITVGDKKFK